MSSATVTEKKPKLTTSAMIASIASEGQRVKAAPFGKALVEYAASRPEVVGLTADLAKYTDLHLFAQAYPERFFQMGMAEQLLMGAAGGLAKEGLVPFATTYAVFGTRRAYDFIHQVIAEENLNVKICCALPGLTTGYGPSHQATEDLAMMRGVPGLTIVDPCDALDIEQAVPQIAAHRRSGLHAPAARPGAAWCSTRSRVESKTTASSSARPRRCARATTCSSSPAAS
jgi:transketolase